MPEHTPLPFETNSGNIWGDINNPEHDGDSPLIAVIYKSSINPQPLSELDKANAKFIVKACNSHYILTDLLEKIYQTITNHGKIDKGTPLHHKIEETLIILDIMENADA